MDARAESLRHLGPGGRRAEHQSLGRQRNLVEVDDRRRRTFWKSCRELDLVKRN